MSIKNVNHFLSTPLVQRLCNNGRLDRKKLELHLASNNNYKSVAELIVNGNFMSSAELSIIVAEAMNYPRLDLDYFEVKAIPDDIRNEKLIQKHGVLPLFKRDKTMFLGVADPTQLDAIEDFEFNTGLQAETIICEFDKLHHAIEKLFEESSSHLDISDLDFKEFSEFEVEDTTEQEDSANQEKDDAPIIVYINKILMDAIRRGASDLHFEPYEQSYRIRFRVDGMLHEFARPPVELSGRLSARLKVMSKLDIAEKRVPQDGRIKLKLTRNKSIDFRVSTLPTLWGEKIVMRILDASSATLGIDALGYLEKQKERYLSALSQSQGMILVTGPTGSGKTVSLYTGLNILNVEARNISTAEDPVEINLTGINQVQINNKAGLTFPTALKAFLRQDPDVIMVGEIRDLETAEIAIKAAQTGHLVLSTLHTNSAPETLTRLMNMGIPGYNIAGTVSLIIAQRLARRLCNHCKEPEQLPEDELLANGFPADKIPGMTIYKAAGCDRCTHGYKGRVGIYEVMPVSGEMARIIMEHGNSLEIAAQAQKEGINTIRQSGIQKVIDGVCSLSEINRVT